MAVGEVKRDQAGKRSPYVPVPKAWAGAPKGPSATDWALSSRRLFGMRVVVGWVGVVGSCSMSTGRSVNKHIVW